MNTAFVTALPTTSSSRAVFSGQAVCARTPVSTSKWSMGAKPKFGPFTPAVIGTKLIIGRKNLNKYRAKSILLHSQAITTFCQFTGAGPKMRTKLIMLAKDNGNTLGFLS